MIPALALAAAKTTLAGKVTGAVSDIAKKILSFGGKTPRLGADGEKRAATEVVNNVNSTFTALGIGTGTDTNKAANLERFRALCSAFVSKVNPSRAADRPRVLGIIAKAPTYGSLTWESMMHVLGDVDPQNAQTRATWFVNDVLSPFLDSLGVKTDAAGKPAPDSKAAGVLPVSAQTAAVGGVGLLLVALAVWFLVRKGA